MSKNLKVAMEGLAQLDHELQWAALELAWAFAHEQRKAGRNFSTGDFAVAFCPGVADMVAERLAVQLDSERLNAAEASLVGSNALVRLDPDQALGFEARVDLAGRFVVAAAKLRAIVPVSREGLRSDYWPFGADGGFCNPNKLRRAA